MREGGQYQPLSLVCYSFSELEDCRGNKNVSKVLTPQHILRTRVLLVESPNSNPEPLLSTTKN